jgi:molybdopterin-containing oxidoreductase family iron-sulfur binding subunit
MTKKTYRLELEALSGRLGRGHGRNYWRSLDELAETDEFKEFLEQEFPNQVSEWNDPVGRRRFLKLMGASLALAGATGCLHLPKETIVPYVQQPSEIELGRPLYFATAMPVGGVATGLLVESHEGRPTKVEGNPQHPSTLGGTDVFTQASILGLYDPDRSQSVTYLGEIATWSGFIAAVQGVLGGQRAVQGAGLRILTETVTSPTFADQIKTILTGLPSAKWHQYEPAGPHNTKAGARMAFGQPANAIYHFDKADVILALDADFLDSGPANIRYIRDFVSKRKLATGSVSMSRLYSVESSYTNTGAKADHRLALRPGQIESFALAVASGVGVQTGSAPGPAPVDWVNAVVADLKQHRGSSLVVVGEGQSPGVHRLGHAINQALGNVGSTVTYTEPVEENPVDQIASLADLVQDMNAGRVQALLIIGGNPVYSAPADFNFAEAMNNVPMRAHLGLYNDETSQLCHWHVPEAHYLESWGDARAFDGTVTIMQPLIAPLYNGKSAYEFLATLTPRPETSSYEIVRAYWQTKNPGTGFETFWRKSVHDGFIANSALPAKATPAGGSVPQGGPNPTPGAPGSGQASLSGSQSSQTPDTNGLEIVFRPDPSIYDGRFANNGWLQEVPKPMTKLTWDNAALMSLDTAKKLGLSYEIARRGGEHGQIIVDMVELELQGRKLKAAAWIVPGHANDCVTLHLGYGRTNSGRVGTGTGFNAYALRTSGSLWSAPGLQVRKLDDQYPLACTQFQHSMEGRDIVRHSTLDEYKDDPGFAKGEFKNPLDTPSLYMSYDYDHGYKWGMSVDLNACVGCNACVVGCQAENNIPVVGKEQVMYGREMHWIRIDRYHVGQTSDPGTYFQPVMCMHCENAPCEVVCPVQATAHSAEGLNVMVYNRCVGTRYCSNNCPYKVRRFNFLLFADWETPSLKLMRNPEVTVRSRGVMEKCTYCVQRISRAKIDAEREGREVRDGEIATACQAACPAEAITFGNINDPASKVAKLKAEPRDYGLLAELNTRPRTTYLAAVRNPNPELEKG